MCTCSAFFFNEADFFKTVFTVRASEQGMDVATLLEVFPVFAGDVTGWPPDALITNYPTYSLVLNERNAVGPQLGSLRLRFVSLSLLNTEVLHLVDGWLSISPALCQTADFKDLCVKSHNKDGFSRGWSGTPPHSPIISKIGLNLPLICRRSTALRSLQFCCLFLG